MDYLEPRARRSALPLLFALLVILFLGARTFASYAVEYQWWTEIGQIETWIAQLAYGTLPILLAAVLLFAVLFFVHARALKRGGTRLSDHPTYARLTTVALLALSGLLASGAVDSWTVVRFFGGQGVSGAAASWRDPAFGHPLSFYFFQLPFYRTVLRLLLAASVASALLYWIAARAWQIRKSMPNWDASSAISFDIHSLMPSTAFEMRLVRLLAAVFLAGLAVLYVFDRYDELFVDHGSLVGIDWVAANVTIPLLWLCAAAALASAAAILAGHARFAFVLLIAIALRAFLPPIVHAAYVRPSEITIQKPFIERHIQATRSAYGLADRIKEVDYNAKQAAAIDPEKHKLLLENVRLWDWRAFHDTVTQIQSLRPYYVFRDSDVDRYQIDGQLRQLLLTPRELDVQQLPGDARGRWINPHFIYTHGYGLVMAEAARMTSDGLPLLLVQDAPPLVKTPSLKLTRPEIYYGEVTHEPVFVGTAQAEFDYPKGSGNVETHYQGKGGFPIDSLWMRLAAAISEGDANILLTSYLTPDSRMMIRRKIVERLDAAAGFLSWDGDPYLVVTEAGRLIWMVDGYTTSESHPYARSFQVREEGRLNYIRNSVKATVDAYDGTLHFYVFDPADPIIQAYRNLFPRLFEPREAMPAGLRAHARYPERIFRLQAEVYRTFHMRNAEAFFNKEDMWDIARYLNGPEGKPDAMAPTYLVATLPDSDEPEFLLMTSFTPRNKDNLIGMMLARCDGESLGELLFLQLSKQELIFGPMQIEARINQDQTISKDLTLWNQQGSQVLRGQMLVLPVENTLLYVEPIYIQASEARMPQLKKVALAMGARTIYADTYQQALEELFRGPGAPPAAVKLAAAGSAAPPPPASLSVEQLNRLRGHLKRYRELISQGRYVEAGREMEALETELGRR